MLLLLLRKWNANTRVKWSIDSQHVVGEASGTSLAAVYQWWTAHYQ